MSNAEQCRASGCAQPATVELETRPLCVNHFISTGYERLEDYARVVVEHRFQDATAEAMWVFLVECIERAADLTQHAGEIDNLQRARLLDILLRAAEVSRRLRRSPRKALSIPVRLRCEKLGRAWEEDTRTRVVSRFGVMLECEHSAEKGDGLTLIRLDTHAEVKARVAWRRQTSAGHFEFGLEFPDCDNFWGLKWEAVEEVLGQQNWSIQSP